MKAMIQEKYGSPEVLSLQEIDTPEIGDDDVLIRVHAAGVHSGDWHLMKGEPYLMRVVGLGFSGPKALVRGMDVAGKVEAIGKNVTRFQTGDDVFGVCDGAFAEYARAHQDKIAHMPTNLTYELAAAVPTSACTALQALRDTGEIQSGQKVLIIGAAGGVGMYAVQVAKSFGAEVTGVCRTAKMEFVRSIGGDHVIDYTAGDFTRSGIRYDLILDTGGNRSLAALRRTLTPNGTLVLVGGESDDRVIGVLTRSIRALLLSPFVSQQLRMILSITKGHDLQVLKDLIEAGKVAPIIDRTFPLSEVPDAIRYLSAGHARGKIVIDVSGQVHHAAHMDSVRTELDLATA